MWWDDDGDRWRMHDGFATGSGWLFMTLVFVLLVGIAVALVLLLVRSQGSGHDTQRSSSTHEWEAELILRRRFASGEIDEDEFRLRMAALGEHRS